LLWQRELNGTGIGHLHIFDNKLQVLVIPKRLVELNLPDGNLVQELNKGFKAFFQTEREIIIYESGLKSLSTGTEGTICA